MGLFIFLIVIFIFAIILRLTYNYFYKKSNSSSNKEYNFNGELQESILTENEKKYYYRLRETLINTEYIIFTKVRIADIIKTNNYSDFSKIKAKHIDFIICNKDIKPILFIELDDKSHKMNKNKMNDEKKNLIFEKVGINLIRTKINELDNNMLYIKKQLNII